MKQTKIFKFFKYFFLAVMILEMIFLCIQALLPGEESSKTSGAVGDAVDGLLTDASEDTIHTVAPKEIAIRAGGKEAETLRLTPGDKAHLSLAFKPTDTSVNFREAYWSAADEAVATVRGGAVEAVAPGKTAVYAVLASHPEIRARVEVTVAEPVLADFRLKTADGADFCEIAAGDSAVLAIETEPFGLSPALLFESADESVARVTQRGAVEGVREGETEVTATYVSPQDPALTLVRRIGVRVGKAAGERVPITRVRFSADEPAQGDGTYLLYAGDEGEFAVERFPENTTQKALLFECSGHALRVDRTTGKFTALEKGEAAVTVRAANGASDTVRVRVVNRALGGIAMAGGKLEKTGEREFSLTLKAGAENAVVFAEEDGRYLKFATSDEKVAEIYEDGLVATYRSSQKAEGGAVVLTVTLSDNEDFRSGDGDLAETYTIVLTVEKQAFSDTVQGFGLIIRKLFGHFGAFLVLGVLAATVAIFFDRGKWKGRLLTVGGLTVFGFTFACFTELLQMDIFTSGRAAAFSDVIIDCSGYLPAALAVYGVFLLVLLILAAVKAANKKKAARQDGKDGKDGN